MSSANTPTTPTNKRRMWGENDWGADFVAAMGEFIGTFMFLLLGLGGIAAAQISLSQSSSGSGNNAMQAVNLSREFLLMASTSMAMALIFSIWIFFRVTGAAFNPNIAFMLCLMGVITPIRFILYVVAQLAGAIAASGVLAGILAGPLMVGCSPTNGIGIAQAMFWEMFGTFGLCMTVAMVGVEKNKSTPISPLAIGFALFATQLAGINYTGAAVNTARAFGPAVVTGFSGSHWIYWVGPTVGAILAAGLHRLMHMVHYWALNPGGDATSKAEAEAMSKAAAQEHPRAGSDSTAV